MARKPAHLAGKDRLSLDDISTYVAIYECIRDRPIGSFAQACKDVNIPIATASNQLARVAALVAPGEIAHSSRMELLFRRELGEQGALKATPEAQETYNCLKTIDDLALGVRDRIRERTGKTHNRVRIGVTQNFGQHIFAYACSAWRQRFARQIDLHIEMRLSEELIQRLHAGLLDAVIGYGTADVVGLAQPPYEVAFSSFNFESRMVLCAHPEARVSLRRGGDANADYWNDLFKDHFDDQLEDYFPQEANRKQPKAKAKPRAAPDRKGASNKTHPVERRFPAYDDLKLLDPTDIDFDSVPLFHVRSWGQPPGLTRLYQQVGHENLLEAESYDVALSFVRMDFGVAILPQIYSKRTGITAFRLPADGFTRVLGTYYSTRYPLARESYQLLSFLRAYLHKFAEPIRDGRPASYGHRSFMEFCQSFDLAENWEEHAGKEFPLPKPKETPAEK